MEQKSRSQKRARLQNCSPVPSGPSALPTSPKSTVVLIASALVVTFSVWSVVSLPHSLAKVVIRLLIVSNFRSTDVTFSEACPYISNLAAVEV